MLHHQPDVVGAVVKPVVVDDELETPPLQAVMLLDDPHIAARHVWSQAEMKLLLKKNALSETLPYA